MEKHFDVVINLKISQDMLRELHAIRENEGIPISNFVRRAIADRLDSWTPPNERPYGGEVYE